MSFIVLLFPFTMYVLAMRRIVKQIFYLAFFIGVIVLVPLFFVMPKLDLFDDPERKDKEEYKRIVVEEVKTITHDDTVDIVARIRNPNPRAGLPQYSLDFVLINKEGNEIKSISKDTYLLPGGLKYVAVLDVDIVGGLSKVRVVEPDEQRFVVDSELTVPQFNSFLRNRRLRSVGEKREEVQKAVMANRGNLGFRRVDVVGVAFDERDKIVGVGETFVGLLHAGEQREVTLRWPKFPSDPATAKVIVLPDANVYRQDNIISVEGDAGELRRQVDDAEEEN